MGIESTQWLSVGDSWSFFLLLTASGGVDAAFRSVNSEKVRPFVLMGSFSASQPVLVRFPKIPPVTCTALLNPSLRRCGRMSEVRRPVRQIRATGRDRSSCSRVFRSSTKPSKPDGCRSSESMTAPRGTPVSRHSSGRLMSMRIKPSSCCLSQTLRAVAFPSAESPCAPENAMREHKITSGAGNFIIWLFRSVRKCPRRDE